MNVESISLKLIDESPRRIRALHDEHVAALAESIDKEMLQPVRLRPKAGRYEITFGHHRVAAARKKGLDTILAVVRDCTDAEALQQAIDENYLHLAMTDAETYGVMQLLRAERPGLTLAKLAELMHVERTQLAHIDVVFGQPLIAKEVSYNVTEKGDPSPTRIAYEVSRALGGASAEIKRDVVKKVFKEGLGPKDAAHVARTIAKETPAVRKRLIKTPAAKWSPAQILPKGKPSAKADTERFRKESPSARQMIDTLRGWEKAVPKLMQSDRAGKLSPEAGRFVARIMRRLAELLNAASRNLERKYEER